MNYKILEAQDTQRSDAITELQAEVYRLMQAGWKPQGGVSIATESHGYSVYYTVCQAMIKE